MIFSRLFHTCTFKDINLAVNLKNRVENLWKYKEKKLGSATRKTVWSANCDESIYCLIGLKRFGFTIFAKYQIPVKLNR